MSVSLSEMTLQTEYINPKTLSLTTSFAYQTRPTATEMDDSHLFPHTIRMPVKDSRERCSSFAPESKATHRSIPKIDENTTQTGPSFSINSFVNLSVSALRGKWNERRRLIFFLPLSIIHSINYVRWVREPSGLQRISSAHGIMAFTYFSRKRKEKEKEFPVLTWILWSLAIDRQSSSRLLTRTVEDVSRLQFLFQVSSRATTHFKIVQNNFRPLEKIDTTRSRSHTGRQHGLTMVDIYLSF